jgi:hypothetical protein
MAPGVPAAGVPFRARSVCVNCEQQGQPFRRPNRDRALGGRSAYSRRAPRSVIGAEGANTMSHKPPRERKKKALLTPKEKKAIKQQKKHAGDAVPLIKH